MRRRLAQGMWGLIGVVCVAVLIALALRPGRLAPEQPLPFSHRLHAGDKQINCLFCHDTADRTAVAGMPSVEKCLLCHRVIATGFEPIQQLQKYYDDAKPIPWVRVYRLSDYTFFEHAPHLRQGVDCAACHGDVKSMDRISLNQPLEMGFCVDCHRQPRMKGPQDCWWCHR